MLRPHYITRGTLYGGGAARRPLLQFPYYSFADFTICLLHTATTMQQTQPPVTDALAKGSDCVVTAGGIQSNHCRATAVAARYLGLDCNLILRCAESDLAKEDIGTTGNLMVDRMVGAWPCPAGLHTRIQRHLHPLLVTRDTVVALVCYQPFNEARSVRWCL